MKVLGIDPGIAATGYAVCEFGAENKILNAGVIKTDKNLDVQNRLYEIFKALEKKFLDIDLAGVEMVHSRNSYPMKAIEIASVISACYILAAMHNKRIITIPVNTAKKTIAGFGFADKLTIKRMVNRIFSFNKKIPSHAFDAVAVAYTAYRISD